MSTLGVFWQVLITAVAISYLLCVLFLSGLQKEDLDVSMLTKLQRYNVNIDDIDSEELRKSCITQDLPKPASENNIDTHSVKYPYEVSDLIIEKNAKYSEDDKIKFTNSAKSHTVENTNFIKYTQGQPYIESSMNNYIKPSSILSSEIHKIITRRAKDDLKTDSPNKIHFSLDLNETEFINKILFNHYKSKVEPTEISKPTNNEYEESNNLRTKMSNSHEPLILNDHISIPSFIREQPRPEDKIFFKNSKHEDFEKKLPSEEKLDEILKTINQFKTMISNINPNIYEQKPKEQVSKYSNDSYQKITQKQKTSRDVNSETKPVASQASLNEDLVKKIAQTVKDMVLHDLRRDMELTTTTTQKVEIVSISRKETFEDQENIMNKVMNMFQTLNIPQSPLNILDRNFKNIKPGQPYQEKSAYKKYYDLPSKETEVMMITQQPYKLLPQIQKIKSYPPYNTQQNTISRPITFQTNSLEIPPLGIPLTHLQNPINQNIIVTTAMPVKMMHYDSDNGPNYSDSALLKVYPKEIIQNPLTAKFAKRTEDCPLNHPCNHKNEDIIRFRLSNDGKAQYDTDYYEKINLGRIKQSVNNNRETLLANTPRFHEKLERTDDRYQLFGDINDDCCNSKFAMSQQMVDCCNEKIASRQQMSIANIKRGSYDDSHFRNFLKTQQKVTDMLEKILATKTRSDLPSSVETT